MITKSMNVLLRMFWMSKFDVNSTACPPITPPDFQDTATNIADDNNNMPNATLLESCRKVRGSRIAAISRKAKKIGGPYRQANMLKLEAALGSKRA